MIGSDALCDIAEAILPDGSGLIAVLHHAYFDESGTHDSAQVMCVAAYLFRQDQARKFSRDWEKDLRRLGLPYAHMTDCALGFGHYEKLTLEERIESEKLLITHIKRRSLFGYAIVASKPAFEQIVDDGHFSLYTMLLNIAVRMVRDVAVKHGVEKIAYFFEAGHRFTNEAHHHLNVVATMPKMREWFLYAGHSFVEKGQALPLQAADMLAWQECHYRERQLKGFEKKRADYDALTRPVDRFSTVLPEHMARMVERRRINRIPSRLIPKELLDEWKELDLIEVIPGGAVI